MPLQDNSALHNVVLAQLLQPKNYINLPDNANFKFRPEHIIALCEQAEAIIKEQPMVLRGNYSFILKQKLLINK